MVNQPALTIVSGGQTGADRAALNWAIARDIPHGGFCPTGRMAEDGPIPARYNLTETETPEYAVRTRLNVEQSDATLIVSPQSPTGGTLLTLEYARAIGKPVLLITLREEAEAPARLHEFLIRHEVRVLNVAGPRASSSPEIAGMIADLLDSGVG